jgi:DNA repair photolyase
MTEKSKHFDDQPIIGGADVIYRPANNAGEYAAFATNPYERCGHGCKYCYVPNAMHITRPEFNLPGQLRERYLERLDVGARVFANAGLTREQEQVFITFSSDPWHTGDTTPTPKVFDRLIDHGLAFCTLTKGGGKSLRDIGWFRPKFDAYAVTLTSLDRDFAAKWEPHAAEPDDRIDALKKFSERGVFTWASIEPTLSVEHSLAVIEATSGFVDLYKIGKANYLKEITSKTDWRDYTLRVCDLLQRLGNLHYIKRDLQEFLPADYHNPLRVPQHR